MPPACTGLGRRVSSYEAEWLFFLGKRDHFRLLFDMLFGYLLRTVAKEIGPWPFPTTRSRAS
jgi:hypothetical protein